jgi:hypothetical protein
VELDLGQEGPLVEENTYQRVLRCWIGFSG